ncbi:MAG TPA: MinD/ParA family protein [Mycobacterium sp.]|nr:MinD/ParA family protein [Mycobacterium sp.]
MRNRGSIRGVIPAASARPSGPPDKPPPAPRARIDADPMAATVPQPPARGAPPPFRRELTRGGTALDGLDQQGSAGSARVGWRDLIRRVTGIDLGPDKDKTYEHELRERIRTVLGGAFPIAVLNLKGGVGKTAVVEALGSTFGDVRDDRVIAVDIDAGDLAERHGRRNPLSVADLLLDDSVTQYRDIRAHTYMNSFGLEVLGLPDYARTDWRLERHDVVKVFSILRKHYSVVLVDCVKAVNSSVMDAVLPESRALVVVTSTSIDAIRKTKTTLEWLCNNGYQRLMDSTVLAINHVEPAKLGVVAAKELEELSARVATTVQLPFDRHVHEGKEIGLDRLSKESRRSYLEMAAALADMVPGRRVEQDIHLGARRSPHHS